MPFKLAPWNAHSDQASEKAPSITFLDLLLQSSSCESFHDCLCWLRLHFALLTKHHPHTCFPGWLGPGLDAAKPTLPPNVTNLFEDKINTTSPPWDETKPVRSRSA